MRPLLLLDIDGVLNPGAAESQPWLRFLINANADGWVGSPHPIPQGSAKSITQFRGSSTGALGWGDRRRSGGHRALAFAVGLESDNTFGWVLAGPACLLG